MKRDSSQIYFEKPQFSVVNDTLKGQGRLIRLHSLVSYSNDYNIPISDIVLFETSEFDGTKTLIFIGATVLVVVGIFFLILATGDIGFGSGIKLQF